MSLDIALNSHGGLPSATKFARKHRKRGVPKVLLSIMLLLSLTTLVGAQDGAATNLPTGIDNKAPPTDSKPQEPAAPEPTPSAPADSNSTEPTPSKEDEKKAAD